MTGIFFDDSSSNTTTAKRCCCETTIERSAMNNSKNVVSLIFYFLNSTVYDRLEIVYFVCYPENPSMKRTLSENFYCSPSPSWDPVDGSWFLSIATCSENDCHTYALDFCPYSSIGRGKKLVYRQSPLQPTFYSKL